MPLERIFINIFLSPVLWLILYVMLQQHSSPSYIQQNIVPCATLFVANLGPRCTESELMQIFARFA